MWIAPWQKLLILSYPLNILSGIILEDRIGQKQRMNTAWDVKQKRLQGLAQQLQSLITPHMMLLLPSSSSILHASLCF